MLNCKLTVAGQFGHLLFASCQFDDKLLPLRSILLRPSSKIVACIPY